MGTNYYWYGKQPCECCGRTYEPLHIGKSSAGWTFALHVIPDKFINNLSDWKALWKLKGSHIEDEYGRIISMEEMEDEITNRSACLDPNPAYFGNSNERGPNNLIRCRIDGVHCVGHGEGPWDYIAGEFS